MGKYVSGSVWGGAKSDPIPPSPVDPPGETPGHSIWGGSSGRPMPGGGVGGFIFGIGGDYVPAWVGGGEYAGPSIWGGDAGDAMPGVGGVGGQYGGGGPNDTAAWYSDSPGVLAAKRSLPILPAKENSWQGDYRYTKHETPRPFGWPPFPGGYRGILLTSSDEGQQIEHWHPTDPRLIAVNVGAPPYMGTRVCDLDGGGGIDTSREARLQGMMRVVKKPLGAKTNGLAWNLGMSGRKDCLAGLVADAPIEGGPLAIACASAHYGGPFDVGHTKDRHILGFDADGNAVRPLHFSTHALWRQGGSSIADGPIYFEPDYPDCDQLPVPVQAHIKFDIGLNIWRLHSWTLFDTTPPPTIVPEAPPKPPGVPTDPPGPPDPTRDPEPEEPGIQNPNEGLPGYGSCGFTIGARDHAEPVVYARTTMEAAFPSLLFRPQDATEGAPDLRHTSKPRVEDVQQHDTRAPVVLRAESYSAGRGRPGSYTQPPGESAYHGGTANGSLAFLPPEVGIEDDGDEYAPPGVSLSTPYVVAARGVAFGAGLPDLDGGGVKTGYSWEADSSGNLVFSRHDSDGATTETARLSSDGTHTWNDHGMIYVSEGVATQTVNGTPAKVDGFAANGEFSNTTPDSGNDEITVSRAGTFLVVFQSSFSGSAAVTYHLHLYVGAVEQPIGCHRFLSGGDVGSASFTGLVSLSANDILSVYVSTDSGATNKDFTPKDMQLVCSRVA